LEWDTVLQDGQAEPAWPGGVPPAQQVGGRANPVIQFLDFVFGAKHALANSQGSRIGALLSGTGRVRSGTYYGRPAVRSTLEHRRRSVSLQAKSPRRWDKGVASAVQTARQYGATADGASSSRANEV